MIATLIIANDASAICIMKSFTEISKWKTPARSLSGLKSVGGLSEKLFHHRGQRSAVNKIVNNFPARKHGSDSICPRGFGRLCGNTKTLKGRMHEIQTVHENEVPDGNWTGTVGAILRTIRKTHGRCQVGISEGESHG